MQVKSLQFHLKHLKEQGLCSIDNSFDYSSIDESTFIKSINHPNIISQISSKVDARPSQLPSRKNSLEGTTSASKLDPNFSNVSDLNSDSPSLEPTREESDFFVGFNLHRFFILIRKL